MATLTGSTIANSYKQLLQVGSNNTGLTGTVQTVQDGSGTNSGLQLSNSTVNIDGTFQLNGVTLTANASTLNNLADLTGVVGLVAVSGGSVNGRTLTAGAGIAITNGDGTEGNPTIAVSLEDTTINVAKVSASTATFNDTVSAAFFVGDGSGLTNVPSAEGGTVKFVEAGTGIKITVDGAVSSSIPVSGTILVSADQNFGTVSVSTALAVTGDLLISGVTAATVNDVAAVSALTQTNLDSITSINTVVANVSALTSVNAAAITSINTVVANVSALTSVNAAAITSINAVIEGDVSADSGTFNTLTVITSASIGGTLNVGGNTTLGDAAGDVTQNKGGFAAQGTGLPGGGSSVEINFGLVAGEGTVQAFDRSGSAWEQLRLRGSQVAFDISGSEKMRIDSGGNVGIGTSSPSYPLHVSPGTSGEVARFNSTATPGATTDVVTFSDTNNFGLTLEGRSGGAAFKMNGTQTLALGQVTNGDAITINGSGNVGIGTSSPTAGYKLDVNGNIGGPNAKFQIYPSPGVSAKRTFSGSNNSNATLHIDHEGGYNRFGTDGSGQHFAFTAGGSASGDINVVFKGDGNVGIGTTAPAKQFEITKSARATITSLTDAVSITSDFDAAQNFAVTLAGNRTLANPSNIDPGQTGSIFVVQDGTGGRTLSFGSYWKFAGGTAPTMSTGAAAVDRIDYVVYTSTAIHAVATLNLS